jgi:hypothetical protein
VDDELRASDVPRFSCPVRGSPGRCVGGLDGVLLPVTRASEAVADSVWPVLFCLAPRRKWEKKNGEKNIDEEPRAL